MAVVIFGLEEGTRLPAVLSIQSICIGHLYAAFGVGLVLQTPWAKRWGIWAAVLTAPLLPVTGNFSVVTVFVAFPYLIIIVLLIAEKFLTRTRAEKTVPGGGASK